MVLPDRSADLPPPYTPVDPAKQYQERPTLVVDAKSGVFHSGARFNEFAKPVIPVCINVIFPLNNHLFIILQFSH